MKIDSIDKVTSFQSDVSPLEKDKKVLTTNSLSSPIYTPYKPVSNIKMAKKAYDYYLGKGIKRNVAAGIVGNLYKESGLNPNAVGDKGTSFGVAQWRGSRFTGLKNYATKRGSSYNDLNTQLDYVLDEQGENSVISLMGNQSPEQAAKTFADKYERPNPQYADYGTRQSVAKQLGQMKHGGYIARMKTGGLVGTQKVADYQKMLNEKYGANLTEDGAWGNKTEEAYKKYILQTDVNTPITRTQSNNKGNYNINQNTGDTLFVDKPKANTMIRYEKKAPSILDNVKVNIKAKDLPKELGTPEKNRPVPLGKKVDYLGLKPKTVNGLKQIKSDTEVYKETRKIETPITKPLVNSTTYVRKPTVDEYKTKFRKPIIKEQKPTEITTWDKVKLAIQNPQSTWDNIVNQFDKGNEKSNIKSTGLGIEEKAKQIDTASINKLKKGVEVKRPSFNYNYESPNKTPYRTKNSYHSPFSIDLSDDKPERFDLVDADTFDKAKKHKEIKNTKGIVINTFNKFGDEIDNQADVINLKPDGSIDIGKRGSFKDGSFSRLNKIPIDFSDVDYIYDKDDKNYKIYSKKNKNEIPIYTSQKRKNLDEATDYGKYLGGKHILVSGSKKILVNGSVKDFKDIADKLTKETGKSVELYQLDNGAYNLPFMKSDNTLNRDDIISHRNRHLTSGGVGLALRKNAYGGYLKKKALGGAELVGLVQQGMNLGAGFVDSFNNQENPNENLSAISGFMSGNAALPGIGGILGAISGIKGARKQRELFQKKKNIENRETMDYFNIRSKGILDNYPTKGVQGSFYAKGGGIANPQYEVEHNEVIVGDDVQLTGGKQIASNIHKVIGKTHDQTNPNTVNGTGEDGSGGEFVFSDRLGLNGKSFAHLATVLGKQKAKFEKDSGHNDYVFKNTAQANIEITDAKLQQLAMIQEAMKEKTSSNRYYKFGGSIPQFGPGGDLTAGAKIGGKVSMKIPSQYTGLRALEYARKVAPNLTLEQLKTMVGKSGVTIDDLKTFAKNPSNRIATNVVNQTANTIGKNLPAKIASSTIGNVAKNTFAGTAAKIGVGIANNLTKVLNHPATWLATGLSGDANPNQVKPKEKQVSPEVMRNLKKQGFTGDSQRNNLRMSYESPLARPAQTKQQTVTTPQNTPIRTGAGKKVNKPIVTDKPISRNQSLLNSLPIQDSTPSLNPISTVTNNKQNPLVKIEDTSSLLDKTKTVNNNQGTNIDGSLLASGAMAGLSYLTNNTMINQYKTKVSANLLQNPNYQYFDRSGLARNSVRGVTNTILNNPFLNQGSKQAAFANSLNVTNQIEQEEANRKMEYDTQYRAASLDAENRNNMILNQARQQTMANENQKLGMKQENTNQLFQNINTGMSEFNANKMQDKAMKYYSLPLMKRLGLNPEEEATFNKDPYNFMLGRKKMGGKIKSKYC